LPGRYKFSLNHLKNESGYSVSSNIALNLDMNKLALSFIFSWICLLSVSQRITKEDFKALQIKEDSLKQNAYRMILSEKAVDRFNADSIFTRMFVKALKTPNSFYYPFDSILTISKLYSPDSSFRIFTWQLVVNENLARQHGAIQMRTSDGSLKLFPLIDKSDVIKNLTDTSGDNRSWIGAVYYRIIQTQYANENFYTLLGYDEYNIRSTRKIIEILRFKDNAPVFGCGTFSFEGDIEKRPATRRYIMEFKKEAGARLVYDKDLQMIVFEHLISETNEPKKKWTLIPDGDYEGFKWKNGKWIMTETNE
jgi:hypothetical protein